jgi:methyl-accepting chemotaxis protein
MTDPRATDASARDDGESDATADEAQWVRRTIWLGRAIVLCAVVATVMTLILVQRFGRTYEDGLEVTTESAELVADSVEPVQLLVNDLTDLADALGDGIEGTRVLLATVGDTTDAIGNASSTNLADTADGAAGVADDLAGVLETIERFIPGDSQSVAEELRTLADGLEPVAEQLRDLGDELQSGAVQLEEADTTLEQLSVSVADVSAGIDELVPAFDRLQVTASDLAVRADEATDRVGTDLWLLRMVVVVLGLALAFAGIAVERFARHLGERSRFLSTI